MLARMSMFIPRTSESSLTSSMLLVHVKVSFLEYTESNPEAVQHLRVQGHTCEKGLLDCDNHVAQVWRAFLRTSGLQFLPLSAQTAWDKRIDSLSCLCTFQDLRLIISNF